MLLFVSAINCSYGFGNISSSTSMYISSYLKDYNTSSFKLRQTYNISIESLTLLKINK